MVGSGVREKECSYGCWTDFDPEKRGLRVTEKKDFPKFKIKDDEERIIPINDDLVAILKARQKRYPKSRLIFPTAKGEPDGHKLRLLKKLAFRAGLNCGHCQARDEYTGKLKSCSEHPVCDKWTLHDFRRTYATMLDNTRDPKIWKAVNKALPGLLTIVNAKS
jgi:integrase